MKSLMAFLSLLVASLWTSGVEASVFLPSSSTKSAVNPRSFAAFKQRQDIRLALRKQQQRSSPMTAMAIPGYGITEQVFVGGFMNFLSIYNILLTGSILLSWFPQARGVGALQPLYAVTDPFLNLFRGVVPPLFGLDFSPIAAFFLLNLVTNATAAIGAEIPPELRAKLGTHPAWQRPNPMDALRARLLSNNQDQQELSLNY